MPLSRAPPKPKAPKFNPVATADPQIRGQKVMCICSHDEDEDGEVGRTAESTESCDICHQQNDRLTVA